MKRKIVIIISILLWSMIAVFEIGQCVAESESYWRVMVKIVV